MLASGDFEETQAYIDGEKCADYPKIEEYIRRQSIIKLYQAEIYYYVNQTSLINEKQSEQMRAYYKIQEDALQDGAENEQPEPYDKSMLLFEPYWDLEQYKTLNDLSIEWDNKMLEYNLALIQKR